MRKLKYIVAAAFVAAALGGPPALADEATKQETAQAPAAAAAGEFAARGAETCLKCHDKAPATDILHTAHAVKGDPRSPFAQQQCEACHGASPQHLQKPAEGAKRASPTVVFGQTSKNTVAEQNAVCEGCHENGARINWKGSEHQFSNITCVSCHDLHTVRDPVLAKTDQPEVCFNCHKEQRAQTHRQSHHPIKEGKVTCSECHNPHGSPTPKMLVGVTTNDTCYNCHTEKRGPFLWEHAPVREDCTICHTPHGSTQNNLLKTRAPFLCQQCHVLGQHPAPARGLQDIGAQQMMGSACLNCHSQVHGSNHPSGVRNNR